MNFAGRRLRAGSRIRSMKPDARAHRAPDVTQERAHPRLERRRAGSRGAAAGSEVKAGVADRAEAA